MGDQFSQWSFHIGVAFWTAFTILLTLLKRRKISAGAPSKLTLYLAGLIFSILAVLCLYSLHPILGLVIAGLAAITVRIATLNSPVRERFAVHFQIRRSIVATLIGLSTSFAALLAMFIGAFFYEDVATSWATEKASGKLRYLAASGMVPGLGLFRATNREIYNSLVGPIVWSAVSWLTMFAISMISRKK